MVSLYCFTFGLQKGWVSGVTEGGGGVGVGGVVQLKANLLHTLRQALHPLWNP